MAAWRRSGRSSSARCAAPLKSRSSTGLVEEHHYLGYVQPVGEHLKYLVYARGRPVACLAWSSAPRHLGPRDRFIGWSPEARRKNVQLLAYNTRFLILPWITVPLLASHILGRMARVLSRDWERIYGHPILYLETFVNPERNRGTCYTARGRRTLRVPQRNPEACGGTGREPSGLDALELPDMCSCTVFLGNKNGKPRVTLRDRRTDNPQPSLIGGWYVGSVVYTEAFRPPTTVPSGREGKAPQTRGSDRRSEGRCPHWRLLMEHLPLAA